MYHMIAHGSVMTPARPYVPSLQISLHWISLFARGCCLDFIPRLRLPAILTGMLSAAICGMSGIEQQHINSCWTKRKKFLVVGEAPIDHLPDIADAERCSPCSRHIVVFPARAVERRRDMSLDSSNNTEAHKSANACPPEQI